MPNSKVNIFILRATKRALKRVNIAMFKLFSQKCSTCAFLFLQIKKAAVFKWEAFKDFAH